MRVANAIRKFLKIIGHYLSAPAMAGQSVPSKESAYMDMYYKDSIPLGFDADTVDDDRWIVENNVLRLRQPEKMDKCFYALTLSYTGTELVHGKYEMPVKTKHYVNVRVRSWKTNQYVLQKCGPDRAMLRFVKEFGEDLFYIKDNRLYVKDPQKGVRRCVGKMYVGYEEGLEVRKMDDWYALRNGTQILINQGLQGDWKVVFDEKKSTGIKNSMVWVRNGQNEPELLFSEYTIAWGRHHIYCYNVAKEELTIRQTFYSMEEHDAQGLEPFARHTHLMMQDPYSGFIYIGNGDYSDGSSAIYYSKDNCKTLIRIGTYSQEYRTLSFVFTENSVFWNMDTPYEPQYICRLNKCDLPAESVVESSITKFPLIHSAHWLIEELKTDDGATMYVMSSNREACFYDDCIRTFGMKIINEEPVFYELLALPYNGDVFHQYYPMGVCDNKVLLMDLSTHKKAFYKLVKQND